MINKNKRKTFLYLYQHTHTPLQNNIHASQVHCGSAFGPGTSGLPYYCAPLVCVLTGLGGFAVWRFYKQTNKQTNFQPEKLEIYQINFKKISNNIRDAFHGGGAQHYRQPLFFFNDGTHSSRSHYYSCSD